jgi:hypothetical protein
VKDQIVKDQIVKEELFVIVFVVIVFVVMRNIIMQKISCRVAGLDFWTLMLLTKRRRRRRAKALNRLSRRAVTVTIARAKMRVSLTKKILCVCPSLLPST